jgi:2-oxoisovalerate dehydrogenase E2 component (dihydrolipoyl transacylase)
MGMTRVVKLPDIGEGVAEAEVVAWRVKPGDQVREDQTLAEVMTDKATVEIPSPSDGTVLTLGAEPGTMVAVGGELLRLEVAGRAAAPPEVAPQKPRVSVTAAIAPNPPPAGSAITESAVVQATAPAAPAVRRRAASLGIDLRGLKGTGPEGRVLHEDLDALLRTGGAGAKVASVLPPSPSERPESTEIPVVGLRRRTAERMSEAVRKVAHFSYVEEVDVTALEELRAALNAKAAERKLTPLPFLVLVLARAVRDFPKMNAHYDDEARVLRQFGPAHIGIATQTAAGLLVPVLRHAERLDLWGCTAELARLVEETRQGTARREQLSGSTITLTSLGALGGIASTPLINLPEVAIIGVNRMAVRPVWDEGAFRPRTMMNLSCSFDHRVIDGFEAASFVRRIKELLEVPALVLVPGGDAGRMVSGH